MKILQVNVVYPNGSTGKIMQDIHDWLIKNGLESVVCYGRGRKINQKNVYKTSSEFLAKVNVLRARLTGIQYNGSYIATKHLIHIIKKENPEIVHLHCINGNFVNIYRLLHYLKINNIKTIITLHAEFMYTGNCGHSIDCTKWLNPTGCMKCPRLWDATNSYLLDRTQTAWRKMKQAFENFENLKIVSVSPWLMDRAKSSFILANKKHYTILNGIDTKNIFHPCNFDYLIKKHQIKDEKILLHVTANFNNEFKGGKYIIELAKRFKDEHLKIIVIGNRETNMELPSNIIDVGRINNQNELASYYSMADLTVLTSKRETFSMVCAESLACNTPVVGFKAGAPEQISIREYSEFVEYGDIDELEMVIVKWLNKVNDTNFYQIADECYSKEKMCNEYRKLYES